MKSLSVLFLIRYLSDTVSISNLSDIGSISRETFIYFSKLCIDDAYFDKKGYKCKQYMDFMVYYNFIANISKLKFDIFLIIMSF